MDGCFRRLGITKIVLAQPTNNNWSVSLSLGMDKLYVWQWKTIILFINHLSKLLHFSSVHIFLVLKVLQYSLKIEINVLSLLPTDS